MWRTLGGFSMPFILYFLGFQQWNYIAFDNQKIKLFPQTLINYY